jgi:hypothetical protein
VLNFELVADSASRPELGTGKWVAKPGLIYAFFLDGGHILAPALFQSLSFAGDPNRADINLTTIDFYFVPKLANPKLFMTLDPAVNIDWRNDKQFVVTAVTLGYQLGPMLGGNGQMFVKPSVGLFSDKPTGWGIQLGFQVLGF